MKITLIQIGELKKIEDFENILRKRKSDLFVFPEIVYTAENYQFEKFFKGLCKKRKTRIIAGIIVKGKKTYDYSYYFSPNKTERYQKITLRFRSAFYDLINIEGRPDTCLTSFIRSLAFPHT